MNNSVSFITGNAKDLNLKNNSVDLVVTQAPFYKADFDRYGGDSQKQIGSEKTIKQYINSLVVATKEMERVLKPIWNTKHETARKALNRLNIIIKYAAALGLNVDIGVVDKARQLLGPTRHQPKQIV